MSTYKAQFHHILQRYGHEVLVISADRQLPCSCLDVLTGSTDNKCSYCFGLGYIPVITKELTREQDSNIASSLSLISDSQLFGELSIPGRFYFFKDTVQIKPHDLIMEVIWDGNRPVQLGEGLYEVSHVDLKRLERGEVLFQKVYTKENPIMKNIRSINIIERAGQTFYQLEESP